MIIQLSSTLRLRGDKYQWHIELESGGTWAGVSHLADIRNVEQSLKNRNIILSTAEAADIEHITAALDAACNRIWIAMGQKDWRDNELHERQCVLRIEGWARIDTDTRQIKVRYSGWRSNVETWEPEHFHHSLFEALRVTLLRRVRQSEADSASQAIEAINAIGRTIEDAVTQGLDASAFRSPYEAGRPL